MFYCVTMIPIKSVLHKVKSIFFAHNRKSPFHMIIIMLIWMNFLLYAAVGLAFVFACTPRQKIYHPSIEGKCISQMACMSAVGGLKIASHLSILVIPMFGIGRLQMPLKKKLLASSVFAFGILYVEPLSLSTTPCNIDNFKAPRLPPRYAFITAFN